jgi:hypothetical protein
MQISTDLKKYYSYKKGTAFTAMPFMENSYKAKVHITYNFNLLHEKKKKTFL